MDFQYSEEQRLVAESLDKLFRDSTSQAKRRAMRESAESFDRSGWQSLAEQGVLSLTLPEAQGGFGGGSQDILVVSEQIGAHLVYEPFLASVVLGAGAIALAGNEAQKDTYLTAVAAGELLLAVALSEPQARFDAQDIRTVASGEDGETRLSGDKSIVLGADLADKLIIPAVRGGTIDLFVVDRTAPGVEIRPYRLVDGRGAAEVTLNDTPAEARLDGGADGRSVLSRLCDLGASALCAEALGALGQINAQTQDYLQSRHQFGRPIGSFQVLQHNLADMQIGLEHLKSLVFEAAMQADNANDRLREQAVSAAKIHVAETGRRIGEMAMQMHGGIGVTDELELGEFVKRVHLAGVLFGDADHHIARYGQWLVKENP